MRNNIKIVNKQALTENRWHNFFHSSFPDFLKSTTKLKTLNLSNNSLSNIDASVVAHLTQLSEIDLSQNELTKLSADLIEALASVKILRAERNKLFTIDNAYRADYQLEQLLLGFNQFTVITAMFEKFTKLWVFFLTFPAAFLIVLGYFRQSIDLSNNKVTNIDESSFAHLSTLKFLDLSNNLIKRVFVKLPNSLQVLTIAHNQLMSWPLANTPESLSELELQHNSLEIIFPKDKEVNSLISLDVSNNLIENLPNTQFLKLDSLDLSNNHLTSVPRNLNLMAPLLHSLVLDGNQIISVFFEEKTTLGSISLSDMPSLELLEANAFTNLVGIKVRAGKTCIDIKVSHNENLKSIDDTALEGVDICMLDLSHNSLTKIPRNLTDWGALPDGVDLQGNPLDCFCEDQWMLAEILIRLMLENELQYYLLDLKCNAPSEFKDTKFVKFLYHEDAFCGGDFVRKSAKMIDGPAEAGFKLPSFVTSDDNKVHLELTTGPGFVIIIVLCVLILIVMILVGIRWQRDQDRKLAMRNRLYEYGY